MYTLILSIFAVFAFCEAAHVAEKNRGCNELMKCMAPLAGLQSGDVSSVTAFADDDQYDQLCQANTDFQSCFAAKKDDCEDPTVLSMITGPAEILDYLCSDEGREGLEKIADSPCVTDQKTLLAAQQSMEECLQNFQLEFQMALYTALASGEDAQSVDLCSFIDSLTSCIMSSLSNHCGSDFGNFAEKIWEMAFKQVAGQMGCSLQARQIRHLKTRIFPLVLAGAKRRR